MKSTLWIWAAMAVGSAPAYGQVDFSGGFGAGTGLQLNGTASIQTGRVRLTDSVNNQTGSAFFTTKQTVTSFTTTFQFQVPSTTASIADGLTFCWQNSAATALGSGGGNLGYTGVTTSVCVKFDNYMGGGEPSANQTGLFADGRAPTTATGAGDLVVDLTPFNIDIRDTLVKTVVLTYDGTTLAVSITDGTDTYTANWPINIPAKVGAATAWVGFTGATGGLNARQEIVNWAYTNPPPAPASLTASDDQTGQVTLTWAASAGAVSYNVYRGTASGGPYVLVTNVAAPTTTYVDVVAPGQYYYVVTALGGGGESGYSPEDAGFSVPVPRTQGHEEGLFGDQCACGSTASGSRGFAALAAALALLGLRRRQSFL
jgi:MYXO-CTERM domain-containing protein